MAFIRHGICYLIRNPHSTGFTNGEIAYLSENFLNRYKGDVMHYLKLGMAMYCLLFFSGCAAIAVTTGGLGIGYAFTNVAHKTINYPLDKVNGAIEEASEKMAIKIIENRRIEGGRVIEASTKNLSILITLESVTPKTTKLTINASKGLFQKDKSTATAIIHKTEKLLGTPPSVKLASYP